MWRAGELRVFVEGTVREEFNGLVLRSEKGLDVAKIEFEVKQVLQLESQPSNKEELHVLLFDVACPDRLGIRESYARLLPGESRSELMRKVAFEALRDGLQDFLRKHSRTLFDGSGTFF